MTRIVFQEFDAFADAINGVAGRFVPTGRTQAEWWVQVVSVGRLAIQQVQIGGASAFAGDGRDRAITLGIPLTAPQRIRIDGDFLTTRSFIAVREGQPFTFAARQATRWAGVTIPTGSLLPEEVEAAVLAGTAGHGRRGTHTFSDPTYVRTLRSIVSRLCADDAASVLPTLGNLALEEEIAALASRLLQASAEVKSKHTGRPRYDRSVVIARVLNLLEARHGHPLLLRELCEASRVSERTLRAIFHEYFGVGPMRLIKLRQLHEIRSALLAAEPSQERLHQVLARFGVSDPTLFTRNYKAVYDELPSQTLRQTPLRSRPEALATPTWLQYATRRFDYTC